MAGRFGMASTVAGLALAAGTPAQGRIYGYENIRRHLQRQKRYYGDASGSLAPYRHNNAREIARRLRQAERIAENRLARAQRFTRRSDPDFGLTRRWQRVPL